MITCSGVKYTRRRMWILLMKISGQIPEITNSRSYRENSRNCNRIATKGIYRNSICGFFWLKPYRGGK
jgi:hypothetical protein